MTRQSSAVWTALSLPVLIWAAAVAANPPVPAPTGPGPLDGEGAQCDVIPPINFVILFGRYISGEVSDIVESDDQYLAIQQWPALTPLLPVISVEINSQALADDPAVMTVIMEGHATAQPSNVPQRIELYDFDAASWETVDNRIATPADSTAEIVVDTDAGRFVEDLAFIVRARLSWFNPGNVISPNWRANIDRLQWLLTPETLTYPDFPNAEAEQVALEMLGPGGDLLPDQATYDRIVRDMELIRQAEPRLVPEIHSPEWLPNHLIVKLVEGAPLDAYRCLNSYYRVIDVRHLFGQWYVLTFDGNLNVEALGVEYAALPGVEFAEPDHLIGGQNFWVPTVEPNGVWRWNIDDGFHDCFDGCDCHRLYEFTVDANGVVTRISYEEVGQPWCVF